MNPDPQSVRMASGKLIDPLAALFIRLHVRPNLITTVGTLVIIGSATAFGLGWVRSGGFLLLVSGIFDMVDGRVARRADMSTTFGAFYDSTLDRVGESVLFSGIAVYFLRGGCAPRAPGARGGGVPHRPGGVLDRGPTRGPAPKDWALTARWA